MTAMRSPFSSRLQTSVFIVDPRFSRPECRTIAGLVFVRATHSNAGVVSVMVDETPPNVRGRVTTAAENRIDFLAVQVDIPRLMGHFVSPRFENLVTVSFSLSIVK
jgi:hypothetical protein